MAAKNVIEAVRMGLDDPGFRIQETTPTTARPGSKEKVAILAARCQAGQELFHAEDRNCFPDRVDSALRGLTVEDRTYVCRARGLFPDIATDD